MKIWHWVVIVPLAAILAVAVVVFGEIRRLDVEQISPDLHVLYGAGGNVAVLKTQKGTVIVDSMTLHYQGQRIKAKAEALTNDKVVMVINTHYHLDHTHGNPALARHTCCCDRADAAPFNHL